MTLHEGAAPQPSLEANAAVIGKCAVTSVETVDIVSEVAALYDESDRKVSEILHGICKAAGVKGGQED